MTAATQHVVEAPRPSRVRVVSITEARTVSKAVVPTKGKDGKYWGRATHIVHWRPEPPAHNDACSPTCGCIAFVEEV